MYEHSWLRGIVNIFQYKKINLALMLMNNADICRIL